MKRFFCSLLAATLCSVAATATHQSQDSLLHYSVDMVEVIAVRASGASAVAHTNLSEADISRHRYGMDFPSVLALTPSVIATNETGIGSGATSLRLRGTDATRLNVTINGVAMNNHVLLLERLYKTDELK